MIPLDPEEIFVILFAVFIAIVGSILLMRLMKSSAKYRLGRYTWPEPRQKGWGDPATVVRLSDFQTGLVGPMGISVGLPPHMGPHLLANDRQRVVLRGGARQHAQRFVLISFIALPVFLVWGATEVLDVVRFINSETARLGVDAMPDGTLRSFFFDPTLMGFVYSKIHHAQVILAMEASTASNIVVLLKSRTLSPVYFGMFLMIIAVIILWPTAAPIVVDRGRRIVYTCEGSRIWAAHLDGIAVTMAQGPFRATSLAFCLYDIDAADNVRWHPIAAYLSWSEMFSKLYHAEGIVAENRWQAMRLWLAMFAAGHEPHPEPSAFGLIRLIASRQASLGRDIDVRIDAAIAEGRVQKGPFAKTQPAPAIGSMLIRLEQPIHREGRC